MNDPYWYFLYSEQQQQHRSELENKMSRTFIPGTVIVNGQKKKFTEKSTKDNNIFPDTKIVAEGLESIMKYTDIKVRKG